MDSDETSDETIDFWTEAVLLQRAVTEMRISQGKVNPMNCDPGSDQFEEVVADYTRDLADLMLRTVYNHFKHEPN